MALKLMTAGSCIAYHEWGRTDRLAVRRRSVWCYFTAVVAAGDHGTT